MVKRTQETAGKGFFTKDMQKRSLPEAGVEPTTFALADSHSQLRTSGPFSAGESSVPRSPGAPQPGWTQASWLPVSAQTAAPHTPANPGSVAAGVSGVVPALAFLLRTSLPPSSSSQLAAGFSRLGGTPRGGMWRPDVAVRGTA